MKRRLLLALVAVGILGLFGARSAQSAAPPTSNSGQCVVHNIDVGQGSATLVQTLDGKNILIDSGNIGESDRLVGYLEKLKIKQIDAFVITHRHMDHIGGVQGVAANFPVKKVIGPWEREGIPTTAMVHLAHLRQNLAGATTPSNRPEYEAATAGKVFTVGTGCALETIWPTVGTGGKPVGDFNEESVLMRIVQKSPSGDKASFLVGGDLVAGMERHLARTAPEKLEADWMVGNHHGSRGSTDYEYLAAVTGGVSRLMSGLLIRRTQDTSARALALQLFRAHKRPDFAKLIKLLGPTSAAQCVAKLATSARGIVKPQAEGEQGEQGEIETLAAQIKQMCAGDPKARNRYMIYGVGKNSYGHPNSMRVALSQIAGFTPMTTQDYGFIAMTRRVGKDGKWEEAWTPQALGKHIAGMPELGSSLQKMASSKGGDEEKGGDSKDYVEATYNWQLRNPQPVVSWDAKWDTSTTWQAVSREVNKGKSDWVGLYVYHLRRAKTGNAESKRIVEEMRAKIDKPWHGRDLNAGVSLVKRLNDEYQPKAGRAAAPLFRAAAARRPALLSSLNVVQPQRRPSFTWRQKLMRRLAKPQRELAADADGAAAAR